MKLILKRFFLSIPNSILAFSFMAFWFKVFTYDVLRIDVWLVIFFVAMAFSALHECLVWSFDESSRETTDDIKIESPVSTGRKEKEK